MRWSRLLVPVTVALSCFTLACGPTKGSGDDDDTDPDGGSGRCTPGVNVCVGDEVHACTPAGQVGDLLETCAIGACGGGVCVDPCATAAANRSYIGCEYWPVDLDNAVEVQGTEIFPGFGCPFGMTTVPPITIPVCSGGTTGISGQCDYGMSCADSPGTTCQSRAVCALDAQHSPFAVVVSNPQATPVTVTLSNGAGQSMQATVAPRAVSALFPQQMGFADQSLDHSGIEAKAYRLVASAPIVAYQFNPLDNVGVFSNDASLLIPRHAYDTAYTGVTYKTLKRRPLRNDYNGYLTVVASAPGATMVSVTPKVAVRAGNQVAALAAGAPQTFTLQQFQTLTLEAVADGDLTGTPITCSQPCGVFGGHEATTLSNQPQSPCCADHLEDQIFPDSTWGKVYVVAHSKTRQHAVPDLIRVVAQRPGTVVTFNPPQSGCAAPLGPGQFCDVFSPADVEVSATEPILVAHFLLSNIPGDGTSDVGDPAMAFAVPTEQYRTTYTLLVPQQYDANFFSVVAPAAGAVMLDGADVTSQLAPVAGGQYKAGRLQVSAGPHTLDCPGKCGVEVYGWSEAVSYLFAGGLDLEQIVIN